MMKAFREAAYFKKGNFKEGSWGGEKEKSERKAWRKAWIEVQGPVKGSKPKEQCKPEGMWASGWNHRARELDSSSHKCWELGCQNIAGLVWRGDEGWVVAWMIEGASQVGISGEKDGERCRCRPDPDGRAEGDLRGVNTGVGMWEMGVREMCWMWQPFLCISLFSLGTHVEDISTFKWMLSL